MLLHEALYTTRAMRRLKPDPIPLAVQARILDAAIRAPHVNQGWRFILVDDRAIMARLAELYDQAWHRFLAGNGVSAEILTQLPGNEGRSARSAIYLADHFQDVPLLLLGFGRLADGSDIYPALWNAMLAARAEGVGATITGMLQSFAQTEMCDLIQVPADSGWRLCGVVPMGYPLGNWGVAQRKPVDDVAARNTWTGELGFTVPKPLWSPDADVPEGEQ